MKKSKTVKEILFLGTQKSHDVRRVVSQIWQIDWGGLVWYWLPLLTYAMAIVYLSSLSVPEHKLAIFLKAIHSLIPAEGDMFSGFCGFCGFNDKLYHMVEYAVLAVLTYRALRYSLKDASDISLGMLSVIGVVAFGCSDELHQWFIPLRQTDGLDLLADSLGGVLGVGVWQSARRIPVIRLWEERIPLKLQVALDIHVLKI